MSTIAVIGATGYAGGHITVEALARGHEVIAVSRTAPAETRPGVTVRAGSIADIPFVAELARQASTVVVAVHGAVDGKPFLSGIIADVLEAVGAGGARLGVVGGAGSLHVAPGGPRLIDTPEFPEQFKAEAGAHAAALDVLRSTETTTDWFYVSPAVEFGSFAPGVRTGRYRLGDDLLVTDAEGKSAISGADYAIAFLDEIEKPAHHRARFAVAY